MIGSTDPTATFVASANVYTNGRKNIAYLFADNPDSGIKCGEAEAIGEITLPFKLGWILIKEYERASQDWIILDTTRGIPATGSNDLTLNPNLDSAETLRGWIDIISEDGSNFVYQYRGNGPMVYVAIADTTVLFYDEAAGKAVNNLTLTKRYGVDPLTTDLKKYGIYPLTEQPTYAVAAYVRENGHYRPIRSYLGEVNRAHQAIDDMQAAFETRIAALESE